MMISSSKRRLTFGLLMAGTAYPALAQFGSFLGGGRSSGTDPKKLESDLKLIIETTSLALTKLADAMGLKESSAKMQKNAEDIKSGKVGLPDSTDAVSEVCSSVVAEVNKAQQEGRKLDGASASIALQAIEPGIKSFPQWKSVADGFKSLDKSSLLGFASLAQAAPKVPTAAKNTLDMYQAGIAYLSFSGVDTSAVKETAQKSLAF
jgi:hypothetical protein